MPCGKLLIHCLATAVFFLALATSATHRLSAQAFGTRVRVQLHDLDTTIGKVFRVGPDSLAVLEPASGQARSFAWDDIDRLERSAGTRNYWKLGVATGVAVGVVVETTSCRDAGPSWEEDSLCSTGTGTHTVFWGLMGLALGRFVKREEWDRIEVGQGRSFAPVVDPRFGRRSGPAVLLGGRLRF